MTGLGAYFYIVWGIWLRHCLEGRSDEFELVWPSLWTSVPEVVRRRPSSSRSGTAAATVPNGKAAGTNGSVGANGRVKAD
jgi:hypothetical protein